MRGIFVTGTGTGVGKSVVAAVAARALASAGEDVAVFKPALTGTDDPGEPDHELLLRAAGSAQSDDEIAPYRFGPAVSPHLAADLSGRRVEARVLVEAARRAGGGGRVLVCEGVGGLLVPLTRGYLVRDFALELGLAIAVVASPGLGTINHTLLTLESARAVGLHVACVVLTPWPDQPDVIERDNAATIEALGDVSVERLPRVDLARPESWPGLPEVISAVRA